MLYLSHHRGRGETRIFAELQFLTRTAIAAALSLSLSRKLVVIYIKRGTRCILRGAINPERADPNGERKEKAQNREMSRATVTRRIG